MEAAPDAEMLGRAQRNGLEPGVVGGLNATGLKAPVGADAANEYDLSLVLPDGRLARVAMGPTDLAARPADGDVKACWRLRDHNGRGVL